MYVQSDQISNKLGQNLSGLQIYPKSKIYPDLSLTERSERIIRKVDFNVMRDPNISLGLINCGENVYFFNSVVQVVYSLPVFRDYITTPCQRSSYEN